MVLIPRLANGACGAVGAGACGARTVADGAFKMLMGDFPGGLPGGCSGLLEVRLGPFWSVWDLLDVTIELDRVC